MKTGKDHAGRHSVGYISLQQDFSPPGAYLNHIPFLDTQFPGIGRVNFQELFAVNGVQAFCPAGHGTGMVMV